MRYAQKMICILLLVLAASFGVGGCILLYGDFAAQLTRQNKANAAAHAQACTLLQTQILDLQRRGQQVSDTALCTALQSQSSPAALWRQDACVYTALPDTLDSAPDNGTRRTVRSNGRVTAYYSSTLQGGLQMVTAYDMTNLYRDRDASLVRFLLLEGVILAAGAAVIYLLARRMTRPLTVLTSASAQIAGGDYARRTDLHTGDEIEDLSKSFDAMADAVQEKIADLQADVQRREDFVGAFTHELKTPMTSIIGYSGMLHNMQLSAREQREATAAIYHESRRVEQLSQKLLELLALGDEPLQMQRVELQELWPRLRTACAGLNLILPALAPAVQGDADLLLDLLCNLIHNAAKASPRGSEITVECAPVSSGTVRLTVSDHGCGIPPEQLARVTEPFYMVDKSRARRQGGSGLGLALCKRIAEAHGSELAIESTVGVGTRVSVILPLAGGDEA